MLTCQNNAGTLWAFLPINWVGETSHTEHMKSRETHEPCATSERRRQLWCAPQLGGPKRMGSSNERSFEVLVAFEPF